jgi:hypothetical protein
MDEKRLNEILTISINHSPEVLGIIAQGDAKYIEDLRSEAFEVYEELDWEDFINDVRDEFCYCCALLELFVKKANRIDSAAKIIQQIDAIGD